MADLMRQGSESFWWPFCASQGLRRSLSNDESGDSCVVSFSCEELLENYIFSDSIFISSASVC